MTRALMVAGLILSLPAPLLAQDFLLVEVPIMLLEGRRERILSSYHDGEQFYFDVEALFETIGYFVSVRDQQVLEALDADRRYIIDMADEPRALLPGMQEDVSLADQAWQLADGTILLSSEGLVTVFGNDIVFKPDRLSLRVSSAASHFERRRIPFNQSNTSAPGPLVFPRERRILGGVMGTYTLSWDSYREDIDIRASGMANALNGAIRGRINRNSNSNNIDASYIYDTAKSQYLTRLEVGVLRPAHYTQSSSNAALRLSNYPLVSRVLQRETRIKGRSSPRGLVEVLVSGVVVDRVEADNAGRYSVVLPTYYGTTTVELRHTPLGGGAPYTEKRLFAIDRDQVPRGELYYDAYLGRAPFGIAEYGLLSQATLRLASGYEIDTEGSETLILGVTTNMPSNTSLSADHNVLQGNTRLRGRAWWGWGSLEGGWSSNPATIRASVFSGWDNVDIQATALSSKNNSITTTQIQASLRYTGLRHISTYAHLSVTEIAFADTQTLHTGRWRVGMDYRWTLGRAFIMLRLWGQGTSRNRWEGIGTEAYFSHGIIDLGVNGRQSAAQGWTGGVTLRVRSPIGTIHSRGRVWDGGNQYTHRHSLTGGIQATRGLRITPYGHQLSGASFSVFEDTNGDGTHQPGEAIIPDARVQVYQAGNMRKKGTRYLAENLYPYREYQVGLIESSIHNPLLQPTTGYGFSFVADPGQIKRIDIPMIHPRMITGRVNTTLATARLRVVERKNGQETQRVNVYRDGGFSLLVTGNNSTLELVDASTNEVLSVRTLTTSDTVVFEVPPHAEN